MEDMYSGSFSAVLDSVADTIRSKKQKSDQYFIFSPDALSPIAFTDDVDLNTRYLILHGLRAKKAITAEQYVAALNTLKSQMEEENNEKLLFKLNRQILFASAQQATQPIDSNAMSFIKSERAKASTSKSVHSLQRSIAEVEENAADDYVAKNRQNYDFDAVSDIYFSNMKSQLLTPFGNMIEDGAQKIQEAEKDRESPVSQRMAKLGKGFVQVSAGFVLGLLSMSLAAVMTVMYPLMYPLVKRLAEEKPARDALATTLRNPLESHKQVMFKQMLETKSKFSRDSFNQKLHSDPNRYQRRENGLCFFKPEGKRSKLASPMPEVTQQVRSGYQAL